MRADLAGVAVSDGALGAPLDGSRLCPDRLRLQQAEHAHQVVGGKGQQRLSLDALDALVPGLAQPADGLDPAKGFFDAFAPVQAQGIGLATAARPSTALPVFLRAMWAFKPCFLRKPTKASVS